MWSLPSRTGPPANFTGTARIDPLVTEEQYKAGR